jgi:hypothetical protein
MAKAFTAGILTAAVVLSTTLAVSFVIASPVSAHGDQVGERIQLAFGTLSEAGAATELVYRESLPANCSGAVWPHIDPSCLVNAADRPRVSVRLVY